MIWVTQLYWTRRWLPSAAGGGSTVYSLGCKTLVGLHGHAVLEVKIRSGVPRDEFVVLESFYPMWTACKIYYPFARWQLA